MKRSALSGLFLTCGLLLALAACSGKHPYRPADPPAAEEALIYFYRPARIGGHAESPLLRDGIETFPFVLLRNGGYFPYRCPPGEHLFYAQEEELAELKLSVEGGKKYFVRYSLSWGRLEAQPVLELVSEEVGSFDIRKCREMKRLTPKGLRLEMEQKAMESF